MELSEVRKIIADSAFTDELNKISVDIELPHIGCEYNFEGVYNIYKFFYEQKVNWSERKDILPRNLFNHSIQFFDTGVTQLQAYLKRIKTNKPPIQSVKTEFDRLVLPYVKPNSDVFIPNATEVDFLISVNSKYPNSLNAAYGFITNKNPNINTKDGLQGTLLAYEFQNKESSHIFNRRESEKKSIGQIRNRISGLANEYENELTAHIKKITEDYEEYKTKLDAFEQRSEESLNQWMITHKGEFEQFHKDSGEKVSALENQYAELLKLQEPIKYWKDRAKELRTTGYRALIGVSVCSVILAVLVYVLLWHSPEGLLESLFDGNTSTAIRWSIIFIIFISIFFIVIRALMKFMFSNFHLARDAEEREKLTYLYLSLISQGEFNEEERKIVMQSLFSRSDTGLLKEDSSPTMPGVNSLFDKLRQ